MELAKDTRDRIFAAADSLYEQAGRAAFPTVDAVRKVARVNMNDASAGMKEWRRAQTAQAAPVAVQVPEAVQQASSAALASLWKEAQELANESLRAAQAGWDAERIEAETLNKQMADAYESQAAELEAAQGRIAELEAAARQAAELAEASRQQIEEGHTALLGMQQRAAVAEGRLEENERRNADLVALADRVTRESQLVEAANVKLTEQAQQAKAHADTLQSELAAVRARAEAQAEAHQEQRKTAAQEAARMVERFTGAQAERDQAQRDAAAAREEAAGLRGQLEAFKEQHTQLMAAFRDSEKADKAVSRTKKD